MPTAIERIAVGTKKRLRNGAVCAFDFGVSGPVRYAYRHGETLLRDLGMVKRDTFMLPPCSA